MQICHYRKRQGPLAIRSAVDELGVLQRLRTIVKPVEHRLVFIVVQLHLNSLQGLHIENVVAVIQRRLLRQAGAAGGAGELRVVATCNM